MADSGFLSPDDMKEHPNAWVRDAGRRVSTNRRALEAMRLGAKMDRDESGACTHEIRYYSWVADLGARLRQKWKCLHCDSVGELSFLNRCERGESDARPATGL